MPLHQRVQRLFSITWSSTSRSGTVVSVCLRVPICPRFQIPSLLASSDSCHWPGSLLSSAAVTETQSPCSQQSIKYSVPVVTVLHGWLMVLLWISDRNKSHDHAVKCQFFWAQAQNAEVMFLITYWMLLCLLCCRPLQGDLPRWPRIHLLAIWRPDFSSTAGWCRAAEHGSVTRGWEPYLSAVSIFSAFVSQWAPVPQLPRNTTATPIPRILWDPTSTPVPFDSTASLTSSQRNT